jgi:hypothetical protein
MLEKLALLKIAFCRAPATGGNRGGTGVGGGSRVLMAWEYLETQLFGHTKYPQIAWGRLQERLSVAIMQVSAAYSMRRSIEGYEKPNSSGGRRPRHV